MPEPIFITRVIEIDAAPDKIPSEVERLIDPILTELSMATATTSIDFKAGELPDAEFPASHSSYFIGISYPADQQVDVKLGQRLCDMVLEQCRRLRLPVLEIHEKHQEYKTLLSEFGWQDRLG